MIAPFLASFNFRFDNSEWHGFGKYMIYNHSRKYKYWFADTYIWDTLNGIIKQLKYNNLFNKKKKGCNLQTRSTFSIIVIY